MGMGRMHCENVLIRIRILIRISVERLRGIEGIGELCVRKLRVEGRV